MLFGKVTRVAVTQVRKMAVRKTGDGNYCKNYEEFCHHYPKMAAAQKHFLAEAKKGTATHWSGKYDAMLNYPLYALLAGLSAYVPFQMYQMIRDTK